MTRAPLTARAPAPRRLLIVSPAFPPVNAPDMQRVRMSLPHYPEHGWQPLVLTVDPAAQDGTREDALLSTLPAGITIRRCGALPRLLGLRNLGLRSFLHLFFAGLKIIRREKIDLVLLSNSQFATFPLGRLWRALTGVPYVLDLQDPWRTDYYERPGSKPPPGGWKYRFARLQARLLEPWSLRLAAGLMTVSENYLHDLRARYPWFAAVPADIIRFGASEHDLAAARALPAPPPTACPPGAVRILYTGVAGPVMAPALDTLFAALADFARHAPEAAARLRFEFHGTSYADDDRAVPSVLPLAERHGVARLVTESPRRLGHLACLRLQSEAAALLLPGTDDPAYSPSKLFPYILAGRPILALVTPGSLLETLLAQLRCSTAVAFAAPSAAPGTETIRQLQTFFAAALAGFPPGTLPARDDTRFRSECLAPALTRRQCALFDRALSRA